MPEGMPDDQDNEEDDEDDVCPTPSDVLRMPVEDLPMGNGQ